MKREATLINLAIIAFAVLLCIGLFWSKSWRENETTEIYPASTDEIIDTTTVDTVPTIPAYDLCYEEAIAHLKDYEGFRAVPYRDVDGTWTIGYGHHMIDGYWKWNDTISESAADSLLRSDLNKFYTNVAGMYEMNEYRTLAIALFNFNCGSGNYHGSTLRKLVEQDKPIDDEIVKWCHYTEDGVTYTNEKLKERRLFELKIYNYGMVQ